jgi:hypothetical protein
MHKSGGPSTVAVAAITQQGLEKISTLSNLNIIGKMLLLPPR